MQQEPFAPAPLHLRHLPAPLFENRNRRPAPQPARAVKPYVGTGPLGPFARRNAATVRMLQQQRVLGAPAPSKPAVRRTATDPVGCASGELAQRPPPGACAQSNDFKNQFEDLEIIGKGSFGIIRKISRKSDGLILARKEINYRLMSEKERSQLLKEVKIITDLNHPNIIKSYDVYNDSENCMLYLVLEYCEGGDLGMLVKKCKSDSITLSEECVWTFLIQILHALHKCHTNRPAVMHRDLKPDNVLLDGLHNVKLADFGLSTMVEDAESAFGRTFVGTPYYMSPELMHESSYNVKSDMWALGCLIYELCALEPPFRAKTHAALAQRVKEGRAPPLPPNFSRSLNDIVQSLLQLDHRHRPSAAELLSRNLYITMDVISQMAVKRQEYKERASLAQAELVQRQQEFRLAQEEWLRKEQAWRASVDELRRREVECRKAGEVLAARMAVAQKAEQDLACREAELQRRADDLARQEEQLSRAAAAAGQASDTRTTGRRRSQLATSRPVSRGETKPEDAKLRKPLIDISNHEDGSTNQSDVAAKDPAGSNLSENCVKTDEHSIVETREAHAVDADNTAASADHRKPRVLQPKGKSAAPSTCNLFSPSAPKTQQAKATPRKPVTQQGSPAFWLRQAAARRSSQQRAQDAHEKNAGATHGWTGSATIPSPTAYARQQRRPTPRGTTSLGKETDAPRGGEGAAARRVNGTKSANSSEALDWYETPSPFLERRQTISH